MSYGKRKRTSFSSSRKRQRKTPYMRKRPSYKRKLRSSRGSFNKKVLQVIKKTAEPKYIHNNLTALTTLYHNSFNFAYIYQRNANDTPWPMQGDGIGMRNGNEIYGKGFMLRGSFCFAGDRRGTSLRFYLATPKENNIPLIYNNVFQNITNNVALDPLDKCKYPACKFLGTYKVPDRSAPTTSIDGTFELIDANVIFKKWIPFNKKINFMPGTNTPTKYLISIFYQRNPFDVKRETLQLCLEIKKKHPTAGRSRTFLEEGAYPQMRGTHVGPAGKRPLVIITGYPKLRTHIIQDPKTGPVLAAYDHPRSAVRYKL